MTNDYEISWLQKDLESMGKRLGQVLNSLNEKTNILEDVKEDIVYAISQKDQDYGMPEEEAIHFRMRKVFSILNEALDKVDNNRSCGNE